MTRDDYRARRNRGRDGRLEYLKQRATRRARPAEITASFRRRVEPHVEYGLSLDLADSETREKAGPKNGATSW